MRVWTPFGVEAGSPRTPEVVAALGDVARAAAERELTVGLEFHGETLTATPASANFVLDAVAAPNLTSSWQPPYWCPPRSSREDAADVVALAPRLSHLHVYEWAAAEDRRPLADGTERWRAVLAALHTAAAPARPAPRVAFLEFVRGDEVGALLADARTLHDLLREEQR